MPALRSASFRTAPWLPWLAAFLPGILILILLWPLRVPVPHLDGWVFVKEYSRLMEGGYDSKQFLEPHYAHPSAVGKLIYFAVLHWLGGNVGVLPLLMWAIAAVITACVCFLARPLWKKLHPFSGALLMLLVGLTIFSAAQGEVWIWGFLFQNSMPGFCLALGLVVLSSGPFSAWRLLAAAFLSVIAIYSFGSGTLVGLLLAIPLWHQMAGRSAAQRWLTVGGWVVFIAFIGWYSLRMLEPYEPTNPLNLLERPLVKLHFILAVLGQMLGKGTVVEPRMLCAVFGALFLILFAACTVYVIRHRRDRDLVTAALPWITCCLYGLGIAVLICIGRSYNSVRNALEERYSALTMFFIFGTVLLAAVVGWHVGWGGRHRRAVEMTAPVLVALLMMAHVMNWGTGWHAMKLKNKSMQQERAMLTFVNVLAADDEWMLTRLMRTSTFSMGRYLSANQRLHGVTVVPDNKAASIPRGKSTGEKWARFDKPVLLPDGSWSLQGLGGTAPDHAADLILITAEAPGTEEHFIAFAAPFLPNTFFEREAEIRRYPEHYLGWRRTIPASALPPGPVTLRAYIFEVKERRLRAVGGIHKLEGSRVSASPVDSP